MISQKRLLKNGEMNSSGKLKTEKTMEKPVSSAKTSQNMLKIITMRINNLFVGGAGKMK
jgi:hypothetical protein